MAKAWDEDNEGEMVNIHATYLPHNGRSGLTIEPVGEENGSWMFCYDFLDIEEIDRLIAELQAARKKTEEFNMYGRE